MRKRTTYKPSFATSLGWFEHREYLLISFLALIALLLHLWIVPYNTAPIFDEKWYVPEARSILSGGGLMVPEHPSLGKLFIALGISVFGDNPWGWRIPSVIFGVTSVVLFYFICRKLMGKFAALLASLFLVFESLTFVYSGLATLDVFSLTFMLLSFLFYFRNRYAFSGVSLALSGLCKMTGLLGGFVILAHLFTRKQRPPPQSIAFFLASALVAFVLLMTLFDFAATREWLNPIDRIWDMIVANRALTAGNIPPGSSGLYLPVSRPWEWILSPKGLVSKDLQGFTGISPTLWILIIPSVCYMLYEFVKRKTDACLFVLLWFAATYLIWIPLVVATDRQTFIYHFYPTVGAICMAIGFAIQRLWESSLKGRLAPHHRNIQIITVGYLGLHVLAIVIFTPILAALGSYPFISGT